MFNISSHHAGKLAAKPRLDDRIHTCASLLRLHAYMLACTQAHIKYAGQENPAFVIIAVSFMIDHVRPGHHALHAPLCPTPPPFAERTCRDIALRAITWHWKDHDHVIQCVQGSIPHKLCFSTITTAPSTPCGPAYCSFTCSRTSKANPVI